ncbi:hypothetical protein ANANG_G00045000 [Anguilla anguilla]|uniref:Uncharacterized protein n=1 Tax=Anguilla anguilla TaxID=7936 RepID=A0A9D3MXY5_ANGAN|nr:hypothetical protein ANANG_G00045000 [Anguilla anguilla]
MRSSTCLQDWRCCHCYCCYCCSSSCVISSSHPSLQGYLSYCCHSIICVISTCHLSPQGYFCFRPCCTPL